MNKSLHSFIFLSLFLSFSSSLMACICGPYSSSFSGAVNKSRDNIALVKVINVSMDYFIDQTGRGFWQEYSDVILIEHISGKLRKDSMRLMGAEGFSCQSALNFPIGDTVLVNLQSFASTYISDYDTTAQTLTPCAISAVSYKNDTLLGSIAFQIEKLAYSDFKQQFEGLFSAVSDYGAFISLSKWNQPSIPDFLKHFPIQFNEVSYQSDALPWFIWSFQSEERNAGTKIKYSKSGESTRGISTKDLILLRKHILRIETLKSPYQLLAADVNQSGKITTLDLIQLQQLLLGKRNQLPNANDWLLIPSNFRFKDPKAPWEDDWPNEFTIRSPASLRLIVVKVGDLDNSF